MDRSLFIAGAILASITPAAADELDATATTVIAGRPDVRDGEVHSLLPIWEILSLRLSDVGAGPIDDLRVVVQGWGQVALDATEGDLSADGDLDVGYVEGSLARRFKLRLGRQFLRVGGGRMTAFDGLAVDSHVTGGLGLTLDGGIPVTPRFAVSQGDALLAGRLYYRHALDAEVGVSYVYVLDAGLTARSDAGFDGRAVLRRDWSVSLYALWSVVEARLAEAQLAVGWQPGPTLHVVADALRTAPDLFLPRSSILSVFSQESRDEIGGGATWRVGRRLKLEADYHLLDEEDGTGQRAALRGDWILDPTFAKLIGAELRWLDLPGGGYQQVRLYGRAPLTPTLAATLDLDLYTLDREINGTDVSLSATATLAWQLSHGWRAVLVALAAEDPLYTRRFELMVRLSHDLTIHLRGPR